MISIRRFWWLLQFEFRLTRGLLPFHVVGIVMPLVSFVLWAQLAPPIAFTMYTVSDGSPQAERLLAAMAALHAGGVQDGPHYIDPQPLPAGAQLGPTVQNVIELQAEGAGLLATNRFANIDSNLVKNYRNRLTGAALDVWEQDLGSHAVTVDLAPRFTEEPPFTRYFAMGLLIVAAFLSSMLVGATLVAKDFEDGTILEARLSPASPALILLARLVRVMLTSLVAVGLAGLVAGLYMGIWPLDAGYLAGLLALYTVITASFGLTVGLLVHKMLPAFLIGLVSVVLLWLVGGGFALPAILGEAFQFLSRFAPTTYMIQLLFPVYYPGAASTPAALLIVAGYAVGAFLLLVVAYRMTVLRKR
ncbi:MAG: ABC transporter permease [Chloroflexi bacterium]|nr:ABC transporter permease [Chloroflexota bacterium]MBU1751807.1 ABC transporter permease [Chloroflexota bacterium]MBU1879352.1 ABC transporter permease [Chloroflexota bacterium]